MLACSLFSGSLELKISIKMISLEKTCFFLENFANLSRSQVLQCESVLGADGFTVTTLSLPARKVCFSS